MIALGPTIFGLEIPSAGPMFAAAFVAHILAGMTAVTAGAVAIFAGKAPGRHPRFGNVYFYALAVVFGTATIMAAIRWAENGYLFLIGALAFTAATVGYQARRYRRRGWLTFHITGMGLSYIGMLTAFYIDNGPQLPLWNRLPVEAFWVGPGLIGVPLIARTLVRYRPKARADRPGTGRTPGAPQTLEDYR